MPVHRVAANGWHRGECGSQHNFGERQKFCDTRNSNRCDSETQGQKGNKVQYLINKHTV